MEQLFTLDILICIWKKRTIRKKAIKSRCHKSAKNHFIKALLIPLFFCQKTQKIPTWSYTKKSLLLWCVRHQKEFSDEFSPSLSGFSSSLLCSTRCYRFLIKSPACPNRALLTYEKQSYYRL